MTEKNKYQTNIWTQSQEKSSFGRQSLIMKNNHIHDKKLSKYALSSHID